MSPDDPVDAFDPGNPEQAAQLHLNVERIRVPEVICQPSLGGVDSAGIIEVIEHILKSFSASERDRLTQASPPDILSLVLAAIRADFVRLYRMSSSLAATLR